MPKGELFSAVLEINLIEHRRKELESEEEVVSDYLVPSSP